MSLKIRVSGLSSVLMSTLMNKFQIPCTQTIIVGIHSMEWNFSTLVSGVEKFPMYANNHSRNFFHGTKLLHTHHVSISIRWIGFIICHFFLFDQLITCCCYLLTMAPAKRRRFSNQYELSLLRKIDDLVAHGVSREQACKQVNIDSRQYRSWL